MRTVFISGAIGFAVTVGAFAVIADNSFWSPTGTTPTPPKAEESSISIQNEPSVQQSSPVDEKKPKKVSQNQRKPQNEEMTVALRKSEEKRVAFHRESVVDKVVEGGTPLRYSVQVASFKSNDEAEARLMGLKSSGFDGFVQTATVNGTQYYRVKVGPVATNEEAKTLKAELSNKTGLKDTLVTRD